jgi:beta-glucosidase
MDNLPYKEASLPINERVTDLLDRMTLQEKVAQLGSCYGPLLLGQQGPDPEKMTIHIGQGMGHISRIGGFMNLPPETIASLVNGIQNFLVNQTRLGIPAICHEECLSGYQGARGTTFPQMIGAAATWEPDLIEQMTALVKDQMLVIGARQGLSPVLDVARDPRWGRTEETFGEDPYLISQMGIAYVRGLQGENLLDGVIATGKHFLGYSLTEGGLNWAPANIPNRELYEVYATPFEAAIHEAGLASVMNSYSEIDGIPVGVSEEILTDLLRGKMGFEGLVVSDYGTIEAAFNYHHISTDLQGAGVQALQAGIDIELATTAGYGNLLVDAVEKGQISESLVDRGVQRVLAAKFELRLFENPYAQEDQVTEVFSHPKNREVAQRMAQKSITLLKNQGNLLPLSKKLDSIAVIGPNADSVRNLLGDYSFVGQIESVVALTSSGAAGDESVDKSEVDAFMAMFKEIIEAEHEDVFTLKNHPHIKSVLTGIREIVSEKTQIHYAKGSEVTGDDHSGFDAAVAAAQDAQVAILVLGDKSGLGTEGTTGEGRDRVSLQLPGVQQELLEAVVATGTPVVLVLINGRPLATSWAAENVHAILEAWLPGEEGGPAVAEVLFGDVNPGGKLPISVPRSVGQVPIYYGHKPSGGRSYMTDHYIDSPATPLYPFGFGLSYTQFEFGNLEINASQVDSRGQVEIRCEVTNIGATAGDEVVQLYLHDRESIITRPVKQLVGFKRVSLQPGNSATIIFTVKMNQLGFYNREMKFVVEPGNMDVMIGSSSADIKLTGSFEITGEDADVMGKRSFSANVSVVQK